MRPLAEEKVAKVIEALEAGLSFHDACVLAGTKADTIRKAARADKALGERIRLAKYAPKLSLLATIKKASASKWQAAAWILERRFPADFSLNRESFRASEVVNFLRRLSEIARRYIPIDDRDKFTDEVEAAFELLMVTNFK